MSSGYGLTGGPSRCFPFWQEVLACYMVNTDADNAQGGRICKPVLEDYYECLHHKKEHARVSALQAAYRKREASTPRDNAPTAGQIRGLGLLDGSKGRDEEMDIKPGGLLPRYESDNAPRRGERA